MISTLHKENIICRIYLTDFSLFYCKTFKMQQDQQHNIHLSCGFLEPFLNNHSIVTLAKQVRITQFFKTELELTLPIHIYKHIAIYTT